MAEPTVIDMQRERAAPSGEGERWFAESLELSEAWTSPAGRVERRAGRRAPVAAALTRRAFFLGLAMVALIAGLTPYNDLVVRKSPLIGYHLPIGAVTLLALLVLVVNPALSFLKWRPFGTGELIVMLTMMLVGSAAPSSGAMRYLEPMVVSPYWIARDAPWLRSIAQLMPSWLTPTKDGSSGLISNYWLGIDPVRGGHVPVLAFIVPAMLWGILIAALTA